MSPKPWKKLASVPGPDLIVARTRMDTFENPRNGMPFERSVLDPPEWINVVARTGDGDFVFVEQFRAGTESVTIEVAGGILDPGEEPLDAARRELREETGYTSERWTRLAVIHPNPAMQSNRCYQFLAEDCRRTHGLELDSGEDIDVVVLSEQEVRRAVQCGEITHSLVVAALARVLDLR